MQYRLVAGLLALPMLPSLVGAMSFEANRGQTDPGVEYLARGSGYTLFLTREAAFLRLVPEGAGASARRELVRLAAVDATPPDGLHGLHPLKRRSHYWLGRGDRRLTATTPHFGSVEYEEIYPGISWVFRASAENHLEYDFVLEPGADPDRIRLVFDGPTGTAIDADGRLVLHLPGGVIHQPPPFAFQDIDGRRVEVASAYRIDPDGHIGFELAAWDRERELVIDPELVYMTYLGGSGDEDGLDDTSLAIDADQNAYVVGETDSLDFPVIGGVQSALAGGSDAFVAKISPDGGELVYTTYLGGSGDDLARGVDIDGFGNAYVSGSTGSADFPTARALQGSYGGGDSDAFVAKIDSTGSVLLFSTYFGGSAQEVARSVAVAPDGEFAIFGESGSADLPVLNAAQPFFGGGNDDAFVARIDATGAELLYATYLGGNDGETGREARIGSDGVVTVTGFSASPDYPTVAALQPVFAGGSHDVFVTQLDPGGAFVFSTFIGGSNTDVGTGIGLDEFGNIFVMGDSNSPDFPTVNPVQPNFAGGVFDHFLAKLNPAATQIVYSTYYGGGFNDAGHHLVVDADGNAYIMGHTNSLDYPLVNPIQPAYGGGTDDMIIVKFDPTGDVVYSTYLGGSLADRGNGIDVPYAGGDVFVTADTPSTDFPLLDPLQAANAGGMDFVVGRVTEPGPEVLVRLENNAGQTRFRITLSNGSDTTRQVELKAWIDSPGLGLLLSLLGTTTPVLSLPADLPPVTIVDFTLPAALPFPGTRAGARMLKAETGRTLSESVCITVPCN